MNRPFRPALSALLIVLVAAPGTTSGEDPKPGPTSLETLVRRIVAEPDGAARLDLLRGTLDALGGRGRVAMPPAWPSAYDLFSRSAHAEVREAATRLSLIFGDPTAFAALRAVAADRTADPATRAGAIGSLAQAKDANLATLLRALLADPAVRGAALRGLAATDDAASIPAILDVYPDLTPGERLDALATLAARPDTALALLVAVDRGVIPRTDVPAQVVQAIAAIKDPRLGPALAKSWSIRPTAAARKLTMTRLRSELRPETIARADASRGRATFARACAACHRLFGEGGAIGPELTGSQRADLDYVLANVVDPNGSVGRDYQVTVFETKDGRVVSGIVRREDDRSVTIQTTNETVTIPRPEIEARRATTDSIMPEGLLDPLPIAEVRDLVAYLASPRQVPMPTSDGKGGR